jgi:hypothetical protein
MNTKEAPARIMCRARPVELATARSTLAFPADGPLTQAYLAKIKVEA